MKKINENDVAHEYFLRNTAFLFSEKYFRGVLPFITFFQAVNHFLCFIIKLLETCTEKLNTI